MECKDIKGAAGSRRHCIRINRNIVECKDDICYCLKLIDINRINRNIVECKDAQKCADEIMEIVLIETLWNVKITQSFSFVAASLY